MCLSEVRIRKRGVTVSVSLERAVELIEKHTKKIERVESVALQDICCRVLAADFSAKINQPPFDRSPLDGYALNSDDLVGATKENPARLNVVGLVCAGDYFEGEYTKGTAVRIMTGGPIPKGYDCIVMQEQTDMGEEFVEVYTSLKHHQNYCFAGEDTKEGDMLIKGGSKLSYLHVGVIASQGVTEVEVIARPRILLATTGSELFDPSEKLVNGKIYDNNMYLLEARLKNLGADVTAMRFTDDGVALAKYIEDNIKDYDGIVTTGGVSVGLKDIIHDVKAALPHEEIFTKVEMKPGTPAMFWEYKNVPILSLSGNPFAAYATFELMARPMLAVMLGCDEIKAKCGNAVMAEDFNKSSPTRRFIRAYYEFGQVYLAADNHSSGSFADTVRCNCMIDIAAGTKAVKKGDLVRVVLF